MLIYPAVSFVIVEKEFSKTFVHSFLPPKMSCGLIFHCFLFKTVVLPQAIELGHLTIDWSCMVQAHTSLVGNEK